MTSAQDWDAWAATWTVLGRLFAGSPDRESLDRMRSAELLADWPLPDGVRTAEALALSVPLITGLQVLRLMCVLFLAEPAFRLWQRQR